MIVTPEILALQSNPEDWKLKSSYKLYLGPYVKLNITLENNNTPDYREVVISKEEDENYPSPHEQSEIFATEFVEGVGENFTPRQINALIDKLVDSLIKTGYNKERIKLIINNLNKKL